MKLFPLLLTSAFAVPVFIAATSMAPAPAPVLPRASAATSWDVDPVHTSIIFKVQHLGVSYFYGRVDKAAGSVEINDEKPGESKVELTIATDSINSNNDGRNNHLKSPDFFNAKEFPEIKFVSKTAKKDGDKKWKVDGELTLHGVTKPLSVSVDMVGSADTKMGKRAGFDVTFKIKRSDYGMSGMLDALGDEVTVMAGVECVAKK
jgi:polyisoprenoid-binding protein YceI